MIYKELLFSKSNIKGIQEWLCLNHFNVEIDGILGPATKAAILQFGMLTDVINEELWKSLTKQMEDIKEIEYYRTETFNDFVKYVAFAHKIAEAREVGGENCGPWVRLYTNGFEGVKWPWCAGFVSHIIDFCYVKYGKSNPFKYTLSCDNLAQQAKDMGTFVENYTTDLLPGSIFLIHKASNVNDWIHTGFIVEANDDHIITIEGNTNIAGSREGIAVMQRTRNPLNNMNFISIKE